MIGFQVLNEFHKEVIYKKKNTLSERKLAEYSKSLACNFSTCFVVGINRSINTVSEILTIFCGKHIILKRL